MSFRSYSVLLKSYLVTSTIGAEGIALFSSLLVVCFPKRTKTEIQLAELTTGFIVIRYQKFGDSVEIPVSTDMWQPVNYSVTLAEPQM